MGDALQGHHPGHRVALLDHQVGLRGHHRARQDVRDPHRAPTRGDHHPSEDGGQLGADWSGDQ